ncbi:hypothetical protein [Streptomyces longwoodensis]|uniref:hypothetical protein n=1 Tax=Streptomyces longwoodensis TaxID=68231 RepID=UPI0033F19E99
MTANVDDRVKFPQAPGHWNRDRVYRVAEVSAAAVLVECGGNQYWLTNEQTDQLGMTSADRVTEK